MVVIVRDISCNEVHEYEEFITKKIDLKPGDCISIPIDNDNIYYMLEMLSKRNVDNKELSYCFDARKFIFIPYDKWIDLIRCAKKNNINFIVNAKQEYTPIEMENYINKFTRVNREGKNEFLFKYNYFKSDNNPLKNENKDCFEKKSVYIDLYLDDDDNKKLIDNMMNEVKKLNINSKDTIISFCLNSGESFDREYSRKVKSILKYIYEKYPQMEFDIGFSSFCRYYTKDEFVQLLKIEKYIKDNYKNNYELKFTDHETIFNKDQILTANSKISDVVDELKKSKLSPYEKILYVHKLLSEREYYEDEENKKISRNIYSILNSDKIVCIGYTSLFSAIFKELNDDNIVTETLTITTDYYCHSINCVYVKDKKYNIEGFYDMDATANNGSDRLYGFMIPAGDIFNGCNKTKNIKAGPHINAGNLSNESFSFKYNKKLLDIELDSGEEEKNTISFLESTDMGKKALKESYVRGGKLTTIFNAINKCVESSRSIPIEVTREALVNVAIKCYGMSLDKSKEYASNVIVRNIYETLFTYQREKCKNDFAKVSLEIERGKYKFEVKNQINNKSM